MKIKARLIDPFHLKLDQAVPENVDELTVQVVHDEEQSKLVGLLVHNPSFDFLRDEPDLYESSSSG